MTISHKPAIQFRQSVNRWVETKPLKTQGSLIVGSHLHQIDSFDSESGEKNWSVNVGEYLGQPRLAGETLLVPSSNDSSSAGSDTKNEIFGVDVATGEVRWSHPTDYTRPQVGPDGSTYLSNYKELVKLDSANGEVLWTRANTNSVAFGEDGIVIARGHDENYKNHLSSLDPTTGKEKWIMPLETYPRDTQIFGQTAVTLASHPGREGKEDVVLFNTTDGEILHQTTSDFVGIRPQLNSQSHIIYGTGQEENTKLTSVDPQTGETLWERRVVPLNPINITPTLSTGDTLVIDSIKFADREIYGKALVAHDLQTGDMLWSQEFDSDHSSLLGAHDGVFYVKERSPDFSGDTLVALDERSGEKLWSRKTSTDISGLEASGEHKILLKSEEESFRLQLFDARTGKEEWVFNTGHSLNVDAHDDGVTVVDQEGHIFELDHETAGPYQGGAPFNGMTTYTGNANFYSGDPLLTTNRGLVLDVNNNGTYDPGRDRILIQDRDVNGVLTDDEIENPIDLKTLRSLDSNQDGLVQDQEWLGQGLFLWQDKNKDHILSGRELMGPEGKGGHVTTFDLVTQRAEFSARGRLGNGTYPDLAPPVYNTVTPVLENPPRYGEGLGNKFKASLNKAQGSWQGIDGSWNGQQTTDGLVADVSVAGWSGRETYHFDFKVEGDKGTLKMIRNGREQTLMLDPEMSTEDRYVFPYPESEHQGSTYKDGSLTFQFDQGHPSFYHTGSTPYRTTPDGRESAHGTGGGYGYAFEEKAD